MLVVPVNASGVITDRDIAIKVASAMANEPSRVAVYCMGWATTPQDAIVEAGLLINHIDDDVNSPGILVSWPSTIFPRDNSPLNDFNLFSYWSDSKLADTVGRNALYAVIRLILETGHRPTFNLVGHSMGAKIICAAADQLQGVDGWFDSEVNLVCLQGAFNYDAFEPGGSYDAAIQPSTRLLCTKNSLDRALSEAYPAAEKLVNLFASATPAIGHYGPVEATFEQYAGNYQMVDVAYAAPDLSATRLVVADLSPMSRNDGFPLGFWSGAHDDVGIGVPRPEVYSLVKSFLGLA